MEDFKDVPEKLVKLVNYLVPSSIGQNLRIEQVTLMTGWLLMDTEESKGNLLGFVRSYDDGMLFEPCADEVDFKERKEYKYKP